MQTWIRNGADDIHCVRFDSKQNTHTHTPKDRAGGRDERLTHTHTHTRACALTRACTHASTNAHTCTRACLLLQFQIPGDFRYYFTKVRPGVKEFLEAVDKLFELHVYTMGTRAYAKEICKCAPSVLCARFYALHLMFNRVYMRLCMRVCMCVHVSFFFSLLSLSRWRESKSCGFVVALDGRSQKCCAFSLAFAFARILDPDTHYFSTRILTQDESESITTKIVVRVCACVRACVCVCMCVCV